MQFHRAGLVTLVCASAVAVAFTSVRPIEEVCHDPSGKTDHARVRVAWTTVPTAHDDVRVAYCVLRGDHDAKLTFERDAEIVYFALSAAERKADRRVYTFTIRTSTGRLIRQGPALLQPLARQPQSCRVDVCQFFTEPGERVVSVAVDTDELRRR